MKKFFLILLINIFIIASLFIAVEFGLWAVMNSQLKKEGSISENIPFHGGIKNADIYLPTFAQPNGWGKPPVGLNFKKKPIVLFGCSYAYGFNLADNQNLAYKLSRQSKRPVYNRAFTGFGIQHMLYQAKSDELYSQIPEPEYVIYVYIYDHLRRLYVDSFYTYNILNEEQYLRYRDINGNLEFAVNSPLKTQMKRLYIYNKLQQFYVKFIKIQKRNKTYDFALKHFVTAKNEMQKHWKNTKFIILFYDNYDVNENFENDLKKNGFEVISLQDLTKKDLTKGEYITKDCHPTEKAWTLVSKELIKKLNL